MGKNKLNETEKELLVTSRAVGIISILFIVVAGILVSVIFSQGKNEHEDQVASSESQPVPGQTAAETSKEVVPDNTLCRVGHVQNPKNLVLPYTRS